MTEKTIYLDNHATTRVDPRVVEAMLPVFSDLYGNAGSTHAVGRAAKELVERSRETIAASIGAVPREIVFTSGATESDNLAIIGVADRLASRGRHLISVATEHPAVLEPLERLRNRGFEVTLLPVVPSPHDRAGLMDLDQLVDWIRDDTVLVSIMLANHEVGAIQPVAEIGHICRQRGILLHCDATQGVGKIAVDVRAIHVDLMSFSSHKIYGPKGIAALFVRRDPCVRLSPLMFGGGQEAGLRSGTLNVPGIVGFARAVELAVAELPEESTRLRSLRNRLYRELIETVGDVRLNGPTLDDPALRLPGNLNIGFEHVDGEALLLRASDLAISSGSACTAENPEPSHVLRALGLSDEKIRGSIRFGLGRFNTADEIGRATGRLAEVVKDLRAMSSFA